MVCNTGVFPKATWWPTHNSTPGTVYLKGPLTVTCNKTNSKFRIQDVGYLQNRTVTLERSILLHMRWNNYLVKVPFLPHKSTHSVRNGLFSRPQGRQSLTLCPVLSLSLGCHSHSLHCTGNAPKFPLQSLPPDHRLVQWRLYSGLLLPTTHHMEEEQKIGTGSRGSCDR